MMKNGAREFLALCKRHKNITGFLIAVIFLLVAPSCDKREELHGFVMSDGFVKGGGFLLGVVANSHTNVLFVTCRHVVEERMKASGRNFLDGTSESNAIFLNIRGAGFRYRKIANIDPSRWHLSKSRAEDVAWIELTEAERKSFSGAGGMPVLAWLGGEKGGFNAVNESQMRFRLGIDAGVEVETIMLTSMTDMRFPFSCVMPFPCCKRALANAYESCGKIKRLDLPADVRMSDGFVIRMRTHTVGCSARQNCSGSPVLYGKNVIGLIVAIKGNESAFQCLDPIFEYYGLSH